MTNAPIHFENSLQILDQHLTNFEYSKIYVLVDENTSHYCLPRLSEVLNQHELNIIKILSGENHKTIQTVMRVWDYLGKTNADRKSILINLGGGVLTDMGGFIASTFKRGITFINIPTTLLAMVDASAGGKNGIDFEGLKNQIGTFNQPEMVLIEPEFLKTLDQRQILSGLAEMLKHGLIADKNHWKNLLTLNQYNSETLTKYIKDSVHLKLKIVEEDPHEKGLRKILNFGHTFGHAIESEFLNRENSLLHGEAIVIGMLIEAIISHQLNLISEHELEEIWNGFTQIYGQQNKILDKDVQPILDWMIHDKKNIQNELRFSLLNRIGEANFDQIITKKQIIQAIEFYNTQIKP